MPFDQIYWNHYGTGDFADSGYTDVGTSGDVRFGVTSTSDCHSTFSFYGKRRKRFGSFWNCLYRDKKFPYDSNNFGSYGTGGFWENSPDSGSPDPPLPNPSTGSTAGACSESDGWIDSGANGICKPRREWQVQVGTTIVYSWPGIEDYTYSSFNVNDMKKTGNNGNNIENVYNTPTDDHLFQSQNRESCHNISNTARVKDANHTFIGIHKDYPLSLTTTKAMRGFYLILKRKRFIYNEYASKHTKQYGSSGGTHYQKGGGIKWTHIDSRQGNYLRLKDVDTSVDPKKPWTDAFALQKQEFESGDVGREIIALKTDATIGLTKNSTYEITEFVNASSMKIDASSGNKTIAYADVRDKWDWIDFEGNIVPGHGEAEITDNLTGVLSSPLGAPLSQNRDYITIWDTWTGYNSRAAGENAAVQTEEQDLKGLFRSKVPWKNLFALPLDNLDEEINQWYYGWNVVIVNKGLQLILLNNATAISNQAQAAYDADQADTDAKYTTYSALNTIALAADAEWERLKGIYDNLELIATQETSTLNTLIAAHNAAAQATADALVAKNAATVSLNAAIDVFQQWSDYCFAFAGSQGWDNDLSFLWRCGQTFPGTAGQESTYGWMASNFTNYNNAGAAYQAADAASTAADTAYTNAFNAETAALNARNAQQLIKNTASTNANQASSNTDAQKVIKDAAIAASDAAKIPWEAAKAISDASFTTLNLVLVQTENAQTLYDIYANDEALYPNNAGNAMKDKIQNPIYYGDGRLNWRQPQLANSGNNFVAQLDRSDPAGEDHDGSVDLIDAVIHPTFVPRERAETGSVYIKNITIKKNGTVMQAKDDSVGEFIEVPSSEIYTDQSGEIQATGAKDQPWVTFTNLYYNKTNIIHRYISEDFKIRFPEAGLYEIDEVEAAGNRIKLKTNLTKAISNKSFTLSVPRGSTNPDYTWGEMELTEFDADTYETTSTVDMNQQHKIYTDSPHAGMITMGTSGIYGIDPNNEYDSTYDAHFLHVISDSMSLFLRDLFRATSPDKSHKTLGQLYNSPSFGMSAGHLGKAVRHPFFSNELSESLHIRNDFFSWAYYEYLYFGAPSGQGGHVSSKVKGNVTWNKYKWVNYWERTRTTVALETEALAEFADSGFTNLNESEFDGFVSYTDLYNNETQTKAKQFFYGGIDKASSAIWPCYENNIPALSPVHFNQAFTANYSSWVDEFTEAYTNHNHSLRGINLGASANNTPSVQKVLDRPWFSYCAFSQNPGLKANITNSQGRTTERAIMQLAMTHRNFNSANDTKRAEPWLAMQNAKYEKILKRPYVLAQYGYAGDMFGYSTADVGFANNDWADHHITIYESNEVIPAGTQFEISLQQAGSEFNDDVRDEKEVRVVDDNFVGDGRSKISLDNYTLYAVAK